MSNTLTADTATLALLFAEPDDPNRRSLLKTRLGSGTITFRVQNPANTEYLTGTFSGTLITTNIAILDNVTLNSVTGVSGTPDSTWTMRLSNTSGTWVEFPKDAWTYVGDGGISTITLGLTSYKVSAAVGDNVSPGGASIDWMGEYVAPSGGYVPTTAPANIQETLMSTSDAPWKFGAIGNGWHHDASYTITTPYGMGHQRLWDWIASDGLLIGSMFWGKVAEAGRHQYNKAMTDEALTENGGCPKIVLGHITPKWAVSEAWKTEIRRRYGQENQYNQIHTVTRYPSFPYSMMPPENWDYLKEYIEWLYRPVGTLGPGGEAGAGYTVTQIPVIEYGNEQKFGDWEVDSPLRYWDNPYTTAVGDPNSNYYTGKTGPNAFNLHTPGEMAIAVRVIKNAVPAGVQVWIGGWEGDSVGRTASDPGHGWSFFQAWALSSDGAGGIGIDHIDVVPFHPYMYNYDPVRIRSEILGYRAQLEYLATYLGRPTIADIPIQADETGHENPLGIQGGAGSGTYIINQQGSAGYDILAKDMVRSTLYVVGSASRKKVVGITHYRDSPSTSAGSLNNANGKQTYGSPGENQTLINAADLCNSILEKVVRQAYVLTDGRVWAEFEDNTVVIA